MTTNDSTSTLRSIINAGARRRLTTNHLTLTSISIRHDSETLTSTAPGSLHCPISMPMTNARALSIVNSLRKTHFISIRHAKSLSFVTSLSSTTIPRSPQRPTSRPITNARALGIMNSLRKTTSMYIRHAKSLRFVTSLRVNPVITVPRSPQCPKPSHPPSKLPANLSTSCRMSK